MAEELIFRIEKYLFYFKVEIHWLSIPMPLQNMMDIFCCCWSWIEFVVGDFVKHVVESLTCVPGFLLCNSPLKLACMLQIVQMEVFQGCIFKFTPNVFVVDICFETEVHTQFNERIVLQFWNQIDHGWSPFRKLTGLSVLFPRLIVFKQIDQISVFEWNRRKESIGHVLFASSYLWPMVICLLYLEELSSRISLQRFTSWMLEDILVFLFGFDLILVSEESRIFLCRKRWKEYVGCLIDHFLA